MTKNDAYMYAKKWWKDRTPGTYADLEQKMKSENYTDEEVTMVKRWINTWHAGRAY